MSGVILWLPGDEAEVLRRTEHYPQKLPGKKPEEPLGVGTVLPFAFGPVVVEGLQTWTKALQEIRQAGICGLDLETTGLDPLANRARLAQIALPSGRMYMADLWQLPSPLDDLALLVEDPGVKIVGHNLKSDLSFIQASQGRRLQMTNLFDTALASQVIWGVLQAREGHKGF